MTVHQLGLRLRAFLLRDSHACHQLGARLATGDEVPKDERAARRWYERGARRGNAECQYDLGLMVLLGEGAPVDRRAGLDWLERSARGGSWMAAEALAETFGNGHYDVPVDPVASAYWRAVVKSLNPERYPAGSAQGS